MQCDNIIRAKELVFTDLVGDFINNFFSLPSPPSPLARGGVSQFHLSQSCLFCTYQQYRTWLILDVFLGFFSFPFFLLFS